MILASPPALCISAALERDLGVIALELFLEALVALGHLLNEGLDARDANDCNRSRAARTSRMIWARADAAFEWPHLARRARRPR